SRSPSKSDSTTRAPSRAAACATARPIPEAPPVMTMTRSRSLRKSFIESRAAAPQAAVAAQDHGQPRLVAWHRLVLRQLHVLLDAVPALARLGLGLHRGGSVLQQGQQALDVLLGPEPSARCAGMAGDQLVP